MRGRAYADPDPENRDPDGSSPETITQVEPTDWLTEKDQKKVAQEMTELWLEQSRLPIVKEREAHWEANELRRDGYTGVRVRRIAQDRAEFKVWVPIGGKANLETANEARRLCRAFVGNLFADPPAPQVFPVDTSDGDRDTSDVSERALNNLQGESRLNTPTKVRDALDTACTYGSGYIVYQVDPTGGGRVARTMMASPLAQSTDAPMIDPMTGMPYAPPPQLQANPMVPAGLVEMPSPPPPPVERMVHKDGKQFTDNPAEAAYDWVKDLRSEVLSGRHVRLLPHTVENVWEARGAMIATFQPWKQLKGMFPELAKLKEEEVKKLLAYRPAGSDKMFAQQGLSREGASLESAMVFTLVICYRECGEHPDGFYGIAIGGELVPWRKPWISYATGKREALHLPVSQVKIFRNGKIDYNGDSLMDDLGGINEVMAAQIGHALAYLDWFNSPQFFLPMHSTVQDSDILSRKRIIRILPGGEPKTLDPPRYPQMSMAIYEYMNDAAQKAVHLMETAQGVEDPSVKSGRHAYQIVAQAHAQLSEPKQNTERAYIRCSEIELQYSRAFGLTGEAKWTGEDGEFKMRRWHGADLAGDVKIKPGTMTMLSPSAKAQLVEQWIGAMIIPPDEGRELLASGVGATIGLRDDPWKLEIRRQIAMWEEGPPEGWQPLDPNQVAMEHAQAMAAWAATPEAAMGTPPPEPQQDPALEMIWQPRAHHTLPGVAQARTLELARYMATKKFSSQPREWQAIMEQEFQRTQMAAMPPMPAGPPGGGGEGDKKEGQSSGGEGFANPQSALPPLDNPALTGGAPS